MDGELDRDGVLDLPPAGGTAQVGRELLQLGFGSADDVASSRRTQPSQVLATRHPTIGDPHASHGAMTRFHGGDDGLQCPRVVYIAGKDLIAERKSVEAHNQRNADLLAVGPMIPGIPALGQRIGVGLALEIGAGDVIEQDLVLNRKQLAAAPGQMRFEGLLMVHELIERAIEAVLVDLILIELQEIAERRAPIPIFGDVQFARGFAKPRRNQDRGHLLPGHLFLAGRQQTRAQIRQAGAAPQGQCQINIAELPRVLDLDALQANRNRHIPAAIIKQQRLFGSADQMAGQGTRLKPALLVKLAKMRDGLLDDAPANTNTADQSPIAMNLSGFADRRVAQIHEAKHTGFARRTKAPRLALHAQIGPRHSLKLLIHLAPCDKLARNLVPILLKLGYVEGQNVAIEYRWAEGRFDRLPALAADLVGRKVDLIVAVGPPCAHAAKNATSTIPIVFSTGADPVADGLVASLSRPGGNLTGISILVVDLNPKRLDLLCELLPHARAIALLMNPNDFNVERDKRVIGDMQKAARVKEVQLEILKAGTNSEINAAFATLARLHADGLVSTSSPFFITRRDQLVALAARYAVPAIWAWRWSVTSGGLISYGPSLTAVSRQLGVYAGKILKGAKPADLPVEQPDRFELVINLKTAKALGLTVPPLLRARADEVVE